jgi:hypothetical protein
MSGVAMHDPETVPAARGAVAGMIWRHVQHHLNALHVLARLTRLGLSRPHALRLARRWESIAHPWLYGSHAVREPVPVRISVNRRSV